MGAHDVNGPPRPGAAAVRMLRVLLPAAVVLALVAGLVLAVLISYVAGGLVLAGTCWAAAALRWVLPTGWVGSLAIRRRSLDVAVLVGLGAVVAVLTTSVPMP